MHIYAVAPRWGRRPQRHSRGGGPAPKAATRVAASIPPPKLLDIFQGAPLWLLKPFSDQFPVRVCSCPLCIINRLRIINASVCMSNRYIYMYICIYMSAMYRCIYMSALSAAFRPDFSEEQNYKKAIAMYK